MRFVAVLTIAAAVAVAGCGSDTKTEDKTEPATAVTAAPAATSSLTAASPSTAVPNTAGTSAERPGSRLRQQSCEDILPLLDQLRAISADAARQSAEDTISNLPQTPEWPTLSESDRQATIAGIRDAAGGTC
ncbi:hypothetical protein ACQPW1_39620 [Nocardia sp. CA-128927]|uniref:hypothetical protein n=1 Tax=Nocardia sp. CA-128927 TaxID=3239975 RepID=UPI003D958BC9